MPENITCPKCRSILRLPANVAGKKVKCPGCQAVFTVPGRPAPLVEVEEDFEVVEDEPVQEAPRRPPRPARRDDDEPPPRPRSRGRRQEDEDEDRPRRRRRDEDDDEDDDRPRARRRRDEDYDDDYDDDPERRERQRARARAGQLRRASLGLMLNFIAGCLTLGALAVLLLFSVIGAFTVVNRDLLALAGLPGLAAWIVAGVGLGFCVAGPRKNGALGLAIATAAVAAAHLVFLMVIVFGERSFDVPGVGRLPLRSGPDWSGMVTKLTYLAHFTEAVRGTLDWMALLAGLLELAGMILLLLYVRALALSVKEPSLAGRSLIAVIGLPCAMGALILINLLLSLIFKQSGIKSIGAARALYILFTCVNFFVLIGMVGWYTLILYLGREEVRR